jgi:hypothetical protein
MRPRISPAYRGGENIPCIVERIKTNINNAVATGLDPRCNIVFTKDAYLAGEIKDIIDVTSKMGVRKFQLKSLSVEEEIGFTRDQFVEVDVDMLKAFFPGVELYKNPRWDSDEMKGFYSLNPADPSKMQLSIVVFSFEKAQKVNTIINPFAPLERFATTGREPQTSVSAVRILDVGNTVNTSDGGEDVGAAVDINSKRTLLERLNILLLRFLGAQTVHKFLGREFARFLGDILFFRNPIAFDKREFFVLSNEKSIIFYLDSAQEKRRKICLNKGLMSSAIPSVTVVYMPPFYAQPFHRHEVFPEFNMLIDPATIKVIQEGEEKAFPGKQGDLFYIPTRTQHTIMNESDHMSVNLTVKPFIESRLFLEHDDPSSVRGFNGQVRMMKGDKIQSSGGERNVYEVITTSGFKYVIELIVIKAGGKITVSPYGDRKAGLLEAAILFSQTEIKAEDDSGEQILAEGDVLYSGHNKGYSLINLYNNKDALVYRLVVLNDAVTPDFIVQDNNGAKGDKRFDGGEVGYPGYMDGDIVISQPAGGAQFGQRSYEIPWPFPDKHFNRGINDPEWAKSFMMLWAGMELNEKSSRQVTLGKLLKKSKEIFEAHGLSWNREEAVVLLNGLRRRGLVINPKNGNRKDFDIEEDKITVDLDPRLYAVWSRNVEYIKIDLTEGFVHGREEFLKVVGEYAKITGIWREFPVEVNHAVLRAMMLFDEASRKTMADWIFSSPRELALEDSIALNLDYERAIQDWLKLQAYELTGKSIYHLTAEISPMAGASAGLNCIMGTPCLSWEPTVFMSLPGI